MVRFVGDSQNVFNEKEDVALSQVVSFPELEAEMFTLKLDA